jgi:hypothetical protein
MSSRYDLIAAHINVVLPWVIGTCGAFCLLGLFRWQLYGPLRVEYDRMFLLQSRLASVFLADLFTRSGLRILWLLHALETCSWTNTPRGHSDAATRARWQLTTTRAHVRKMMLWL